MSSHKKEIRDLKRICREQKILITEHEERINDLTKKITGVSKTSPLSKGTIVASTQAKCSFSKPIGLVCVRDATSAVAEVVEEDDIMAELVLTRSQSKRKVETSSSEETAIKKTKLTTESIIEGQVTQRTLRPRVNAPKRYI